MVWRMNSRVLLTEIETSFASIEQHGGGLTQESSKEGDEKWVLEMDGWMDE